MEGSITTHSARPASATASEGPASAARPLRQYTRPQVLGIWAAAALPMAALAWLVPPWVADRLDGPAAGARALIGGLTVGLVWQFVLVLLLVYREQRSLRWRVLRDALWLRAPRSPKTGRAGGRLWLVLIPCLLIFAAEEFVPAFPPAAGHDLPAFLQSADGANLFAGNWAWFAVLVVSVVFNTVLGEELLFRGLLLPRMQGAFGRGDWVVNGVLFATYHLHMPWVIPTALLDTFALSYPSRRYRSALIGIAVHSAQSVVVVAATLPMVLR